MHGAQSQTLVAGAILYICTPVLVQPKVSHFFMVSLLTGLQDETRRVFPPVVIYMWLFTFWTLADQTGRGKAPRLAEFGLELEDWSGGIGEKVFRTRFGGLVRVSR